MLHLRHNVAWTRHPRNPVLTLGHPGSFDSTSTMNPYVLRDGDTLRMYYAGGDDQGRRRICVATADIDDPATWTKHGPILEPGGPGSFDARWTVLPHVVRFAPDRWHLYYTANAGVGQGLSAFPGIGLATSSDGERWTKHGDGPVLAPSGRDGDVDAVGIAGGSVLQVRLPDGSTEWRFYYTGCPTLGDNVFLDQQKVVALAVSRDGIHWVKRGGVMYRDPDRDYENIAVAGPVVRQCADGTYRMWYSAIGTRWGYYSICYAESDDGLTWRRGDRYGDNLQLTPAGDGWERQMVEYPSVVDRPDGGLWLFYSGNGYGSSGTGLAIGQDLG